jgi:2-polyprenyl-6-methoxyphenol hydroxylase-like FAD-dependent oxidoreductase
MPTSTVLIIGGGIAGLATAIGLRRAGWQVTVHEAGHYEDSGVGLLLFPNAVKAADRLDRDLGTAIREIGHVNAADVPYPLLNSAGRVLTAAPWGDMTSKWGAPLVAVRRGALHQLLLDTARARGVEVLLGRRLVDVTQDAGGVTAHFVEGKPAAGDVLVGADGLHSAVRGAVVDDGPPRYLGFANVRGTVTGFLDRHPAGFMSFGPGIQVFTSPLPDNHLLWTVRLRAVEGEWPAKGSVAAHAETRERLRGWHDPVSAILAAADPASVDVTDSHDRDPGGRWSYGRITLVGDAAHPTSPALAQGAGMALEGAVCLSDRLAGATGRADPVAALASYDTARRSRIAMVVKQARQRGSIGLVHHPAARLLRDTVLRLTSRFVNLDRRNAALYGHTP